MNPVVERQSLPRFARKAAWLEVFLIASIGIATAPGEAQDKSTPAWVSSTSGEAVVAKPPWGRIVMVGASATGGFTESEPLGGPTTPQYHLSRYLDAALVVPHEPVRNLGDRLFFVQPETAGRYQIEQALQLRPTL